MRVSSPADERYSTNFTPNGRRKRASSTVSAVGKRMLWKQLMPADAAGVDSVGGIAITPDEKSYVNSYTRRS